MSQSNIQLIDSGNNKAKLLEKPYAESIDIAFSVYNSSQHGLSEHEAANRLRIYGPNNLPKSKPPGVLLVFFRQFKSPLIYILVAAAILSIATDALSDAAFITGILVLNAVIGCIQEFSAQRAAEALQKLVSTRARVFRDGDIYDKDAKDLVPGDVILLESGDRVPADMRLFSTHDAVINESLLTGESLAVIKKDGEGLDPETSLGDRSNMAFAGTMVERGRLMGVVVNTGLNTEIGRIASDVLSKPSSKPPLLLRMEAFTQRIAIFVGISAVIMALIAFSRGTALSEIFFLAVALAVSAIPEGLPVALTVALAIGMRRMAERHVIVRRLIAVEALGSCTCIATDKTGTLTVNQLTVKQIELPDGSNLKVTGEGIDPNGNITLDNNNNLNDQQQNLLQHLSRAAVLNNEGHLVQRNSNWISQGDAVDVALLVMAHKIGLIKENIITDYPEIEIIPFESEHMYSATLNNVDSKKILSVKGAPEKILTMCSKIEGANGNISLDKKTVEEKAKLMANQSYRVLALAEGQIDVQEGALISEENLQDLTFLGLVGMIDPLRIESKAAVAACRKAGIDVVMITGDHPTTALAIAQQIGLSHDQSNIVTGAELKQAQNEQAFDQLTKNVSVYARMEPEQKLDIIYSLQRNGHFVAVSGDGANDAPALRAAQVGVAMGKSGTEVAKETAELIITDDNFNSIVSGIEEGRIAFANVRKVIFLLISTGAAELVLFTLALLTGTPLPLVAVQLLWLNLVTNGIQDVALAFEPGEGDELSKPPRSPREPIFNRIMVERVIVSALTIGFLAFALFQWLLMQGYALEEARNGTLLLMVLFENVHVFNSRSETRSVFQHSPLRNPLLLYGTLAAQLIHIGAMYTPWLSEVLNIQPVSFDEWIKLLVLALFLLVVMELQKHFRGPSWKAA
jgi:Ca2+-transporting ATPase